MDLSKLNGSVTIVDGKLEITLTDNGKEIKTDSDKLFALHNVVKKQMDNFEKEFQQKFRPTKETVYILPNDI